MAATKDLAISLAEQLERDHGIDFDTAMGWALSDDPTVEYLVLTAECKRVQQAQQEAADRMLQAQCRHQISDDVHPTKRGYRLIQECTLMRGHDGTHGKHPLLDTSRESQ